MYTYGTFREQVELFAGHGVIICAHGAGLMNLMFTPPFSAVVEIYPLQTHHNLYPTMAAFMGISHYPVHPYNGTDVWSTDLVTAVYMVVLASVCMGFHPYDQRQNDIQISDVWPRSITRLLYKGMTCEQFLLISVAFFREGCCPII